jgi:hypothetical protein
MKKTTKDIKQLIETDEDFIYCPRLGNSLDKFIDNHPDGVDEDRIAKVLMMTEEEVREIFEQALKKLRKGMGL